ncbi:two-component response regulator-like APRR7 [Gossypium hirsutum]|uniref:Two-component response regulator-like APRR7 n=1 Tax=Gossypium hirsutum TaxID=3635 RepID=A0ABM2Z648_GOSHI|nr:two-component response regulator-like APRR7 [Gossypium hirsutum]
MMEMRNTNGVVAEELRTLEGDDLKVEIAQNVKDCHTGVVRTPAVLQIQQQQPQSASGCWERFLHQASIKVLLVENDDSTRHVVAALLRNCRYEVIEAASGLQAWKILEDLTNHIDLVLTEVFMPCFSGIFLLSKIMSHKTHKNVPVIMMSSHDSIGIVFKCLSKGAVDFLVKPIRKNELKNLWQHVWRRCHSSSGSGSGSESGTRTQKSEKSESVENSDNSGSNDEEDNENIGLNVGDGSDDGSGTQSSWTKQAAEIESPRPVSPQDRVAECPDSTCAQVIHSNAEASGNKGVPKTAARGCQELDEQLDNVAMGKGLDIRMAGSVDLQREHPVEVPIKIIGAKQINLLEMSFNKLNEPIDKRQLDLNTKSLSGELNSEAAHQTGITSKTNDLKKESTEYEASNRISKISDGNDKTTDDSKEVLPSAELGFKRLRGAEDTEAMLRDERNVLRRSNSSAFSRYFRTDKKGSVCDVQSPLVNDLPNQCSNVGSNNIDMASTTDNAFAKPAVLKNKSASSSAFRSGHPSSAFQPMKNDLLNAARKPILDKADGITTKAGLKQPRLTHQELDMQDCPQHQQATDHDTLSLKKMAADAPHCGSSNVLGGPVPVEGNAGNYSVNGSNSGSNHSSNGPHGSSTIADTVGTNIESDNGIAGKSGSGGSGDASGAGSGSGSGSNVDQSKSARREAALTKFRQKRKDRCFRKEVRYQSRKRLAQQRPRIRGQFVRQTVNTNDPLSEANSSDK